MTEASSAGAGAWGAATESIHPASFTQRSMWASAKRHRQAPLNVMVMAWRITGPLQEAWLCGALEDVVRRHASLRTRLVMTGTLLQQHVQAPFTLPLERSIADGEDTRQRLAHAKELLRIKGLEPIDVMAGPPLRARVIELGADEHLLGVFVHHAMFDGWSAEIVIDDLTGALEERAAGRTWSRPSPVVDFGTWSRAQLEAAERGDYSKELAYWTTELADLPPPPELPATHARKGNRDFLARAPLHVEPAQVLAAVRSCSQAARVTPFAFLLAAVALSVRARTACDDMVVGVPTLNRWSSEEMRVVGCFTSLLPARLRPRAGISFERFAVEVHHTIRRLLAYGRVPLELIVKATQASPLGGPLYPVWSQLRPAAKARQVLALGLRIEPVLIERGALLAELDVDMVESDSTLTCEFAHRPSLFTEHEVRACMTSFSAALRAAVARPGADLAEIAEGALGTCLGAGP